MECLAMGIPVVASRVGGIPEVMPDGEGGYLVEPGDIDGFAKRLVQLSSDRELYGQLSAAARANAEAHFSIATSANRFAELFRHLRQRRGGLGHAVARAQADAV